MLATSPKAISPVDDHIPSSPPSSKERSQSITYPRAFLLSLAYPNEHQDHPGAEPRKISRRLSSFTPILRCSVAMTDSDWGISEDQSSLFDNQPISRDLPIPLSGERHPCDRSRSGISRGNSSDDGYGYGYGHGNGVSTRDSETLFSYRSMDDKEGKLPILVDFDDPFGTNGIGNGQTPSHRHLNDSDQEKDKVHKGIVNGKERERERESIFPRSVNSSTTSLQNLGIRLGPREDLVDQNSLVGGGGKISRSNSNSSITSSKSILNRRSSSPFGGHHGTSELNPFAPPFPLPNPNNGHGNGLIQPKPISLNEAIQRRISTSSDRSNPRSQSNSPELLAVAGSLPLPKNLPSSLPAKPSPLPPVFVKRESAALPQPMALPDIAPLGKDWHGDNSLSGNEKRRRASLLHTGQAISRGSSPLARGLGGGSAPNSRRGSMVSSNDEITIRARSPGTGDRKELGMGMGRRNSHSNKERW
nr:uncharacterized protein I203_01343 [Kwoniella mangroviensis CBS 8507]OCF69486.1 hypothetical protein I203_01343 [Kwoniella mangroviensis CBS 8507]